MKRKIILETIHTENANNLENVIGVFCDVKNKSTVNNKNGVYV